MWLSQHRGSVLMSTKGRELGTLLNQQPRMQAPEREKKPSIRTSNWKRYPDASSSKDRFCQIHCSTDPKAALLFLLHLLAQVLIKCDLEKVFISSQNNHGEHSWSSIKICFKHYLLGVNQGGYVCMWVSTYRRLCGDIWGSVSEHYLAEGSYACTHGKCMYGHLLVCVFISLWISPLCVHKSLCFYVSVSVKCSVSFSY